MGEGIVGGFSGIYPVLRALEDAGRIRRGYFVDGLGAAQFALAGALDRLRAVRETADGSARAGCSSWPRPIRPTPTARRLAWPRRSDADRRPFQRAAGAYVALVDGRAAFYLERGGRSLQSFPAADEPTIGSLGPALVRPARRRPAAARAGDHQGRRAADRRVALASGPARGRLPAGLPRPRPRSR